ncbi:PREDICTED: phosphatidyl-N-methylethanolamine N-methyltransferase-like, partial [Priapulus caudatus]|uniref:phosphatidyl-N-methylethanolamine N-methyltransferase n=1 Tax=Priapulus caudatus TaxID=37621 RepID=A0ABM1F763_PRICU
FSEVTRTHPTVDLVNHTYAEYVGWTLMAVGMLLVASSFYRLGFMGTYMGDYFGILLDEKLTGFPFNVVDNPMYWGSTLNFLSIAV